MPNSTLRGVLPLPPCSNATGRKGNNGEIDPDLSRQVSSSSVGRKSSKFLRDDFLSTKFRHVRRKSELIRGKDMPLVVPEEGRSLSGKLSALLEAERGMLGTKIASQAYENDRQAVSLENKLMRSPSTNSLERSDSEPWADVGDEDLNRYLGRVSPMKWAVTVAVALIIALEAGLIILGSMNIVHWKMHMVTQMCARSGGRLYAFAFLLLYGLPAVFLAAWLVIYVAPHAGGSGIPEIKACLNGIVMPQAFTFKTWASRSVGLTLVTSAGLFAGTEGPFTHLGGIIASGFSQGPPGVSSWPAILSGHRNRCEFISQGAAMGVAAAFGAPVGGILFSLEEASSFWNKRITWQAFLGTMVAAVVAKLTKGGFTELSPVGFIEFPDKDVTFELWELGTFALLGLAQGLIGAFFCKCVQRLSEKRRTFFQLGAPTQSSRRQRLVEVLCIVVFSLTVVFWPPVIWGCRELPPDRHLSEAHGSAPDLTGGICPQGAYSDISYLLLQPKESAIKALFSRNMASGAVLSIPSLLVSFAIILVTTILTFGAAIPVGLFIPNILSGACFGRAVGQMLLESGFNVYPDVYALMGAAGSLAGFSRMTISLAVIFIEITHNLYLMLPLMLVIMASKLLADRFGQSVYDVVLESNPEIHLLEDSLDEDHVLILGGLTAHDVCTADVVVLQPTEPLANVMRVLLSTQYSGYPVVDERGRLQGLVRRAQLAALVEDFVDDECAEEGGARVLDLRRVAHSAPEVTLWNAPAERAFRHFRACGLQHLCVTDDSHKLLGILTRTDMARLCRHGAEGVEEVRALIARKQAAVKKQVETHLPEPPVREAAESSSTSVGSCSSPSSTAEEAHIQAHVHDQDQDHDHVPADPEESRVARQQKPVCAGCLWLTIV